MSDDLIPLMFQAQIEGRGQIQYIKNPQKAYDWALEWIDGAAKQPPKFGAGVKTKEYKITWRFVSNSGQDEGIIRPVIGGKGWPFYPGASMKGAFLRVCLTEDKKLALKYCGGETIDPNTNQKTIIPGILRFHGGYPKDKRWTEKPLVDVVHPQENWQVKDNGSHSAKILISLYQPTLVFGISSIVELTDEEWNTIWSIWEKAIEGGIGSRVSAGYGQPRSHKSNNLISVALQGQGLASQLIDKTGEFRPNMFKAALRGHTLRLFLGVTDESTAQELTRELWGGFSESNKAVVGLLGIAFNAVKLELDSYGYYQLPTYELSDGTLNLLCMRQVSEKQLKNLKVLAPKLIKFSMLLGGFGKSWRRVDHRIFYSEYLSNKTKFLIGCHWQFGQKSEAFYCPVNQLSDITTFLDKLHETLRTWVIKKRKSPTDTVSDWREAWHPENVQVWGRIAKNSLDSHAVKWFHGSYQNSQSIKNSDLTGKIGQIGRIWHRMYPRYLTTPEGTLKPTKEYVELLTIFPDESDKTEDFLGFLESSSDFTKLWGLES